ncbi:hypothetical protein [Streptomyces peucetius]|uniref:PH domain-containing protein n=1 Tax=Streptomyces peucetius TaxID=1950 RepID=A0ABY6I7U7_STRPE|nr:hypothetical protein [Streptomyces peucetius]UYQ63072.1 hypothetical protein OGH68_17315 [Streptomyces peucetius]
MDYRRIACGQLLWRRTFRWASCVLPGAFGAMASYAVFDGFLSSDPDAFKAAGLILIVGGLVLRITRSRIHLAEGRVVVVNPVFWYSVPYAAVHRAEAAPGSGLVLRTKQDFRGEPEVFSVGFAGSLLDHRFQTAAKAAEAIGKAKKRSPRGGAAEQEIEYGMVRDAVFEAMLVLALACFVASFFTQ